MPARKNEPETWWSEPEPSAASGGLISPADSSPLIDPLAEPSSSEEEQSETPSVAGELQERTEVIPRRLSSNDAGRVDTAARRRARGRRTRPTMRRTKMTLRHVDPISVLKLSLVFYGCVLAVWMVIVAILYTLLESAGVFDAIETLGRTAVLWTRLDISLWFVERWTLLLGGVLVVLGAIVNALVAVLYNLASDAVGGAQMTFVEREL